MLATVLAACWFVTVIAKDWVEHLLPTGSRVLYFSFVGMTMVGAVAGFLVAAAANIAFRVGPPKLRVPFTVLVWLSVCGVVTARLLQGQADPGRLLPLAAIAAFCGLIVGPYHAELFVGLWFYKRSLKVIEAERGRKLAEIEQGRERARAELKQKFEAERIARLNEQERPNAIRNFMRS